MADRNASTARLARVGEIFEPSQSKIDQRDAGGKATLYEFA